MSDAIDKDYLAITVYVTRLDLVEAAGIVAELRGLDWPQANRSLIIREGFSRLLEILRGRSTEEKCRYFTERAARRAKQRAKPPAA